MEPIEYFHPYHEGLRINTGFRHFYTSEKLDILDEYLTRSEIPPEIVNSISEFGTWRQIIQAPYESETPEDESD